MEEPSTADPDSPARPLRTRWDRTASLFWKAAFVGYLVLLTVLLVTQDPAGLVGIRSGLMEWLDPVSHLVAFLALGILACAAKWPVSPAGLIACLLVYGAGTELAQGPVSGRSPEWGDWLQDAVGVATGVGLAYLGRAACRIVTIVRPLK